jgi:hypothetical protein
MANRPRERFGGEGAWRATDSNPPVNLGTHIPFFSSAQGLREAGIRRPTQPSVRSCGSVPAQQAWGKHPTQDRLGEFPVRRHMHDVTRLRVRSRSCILPTKTASLTDQIVKRKPVWLDNHPPGAELLPADTPPTGLGSLSPNRHLGQKRQQTGSADVASWSTPNWR